MTHTILLVEDDPDLLRCLGEVLEMKGYQVLLASSGNEAIATLEQDIRVDLILSDCSMRNGTGMDVLRFVRQRHPRFPIFFMMSGHTDISPGKALAGGAQKFIVKPFDIPELFSEIEGSFAELRQSSSRILH